MNKSYCPLVIRCIRDSNNKDDDDVITIRPSSFYKKQYEITQNTRNISFDKREYTMTMNLYDTASYLDTLLTMLNLDTYPFEEYQFDLPAIPPILVNAKDLASMRLHVMEYFQNLTNRYNWPINSSKQKKTRVHEIYDEETGQLIIKTTTDV